MAKTAINWHSLSTEETLAQLQTSRSGLSPEEARRRLETFGPNEFGVKEGVSPHVIILEQLASPLVYVLFIAAVISFAVNHIVDAVVILGIVAINTVIGFLQEYRAEKAVQALRQLAAPRAVVLRNGGRVEISASELVPGDIIVLATGDRIPADARVIESSNLKTEEAPLTGESTSVDKTPAPVPEDTPLAERASMVYAGTTVSYGRGEAAVVATGVQSEMGEIAAQVAALTREPTPLQVRLAGLGRLLAFLALGLATLVLAAGLARGMEFIDIFLFAVASAVASIPEGLPAVVTIVLAIGLQRMAARNAIIRKLPAVETLGSATVICSDKTGTLTKNEMTVKVIYTCGSEYEVTGEGYEPVGEIKHDGRMIDISTNDALRYTLQAGALCNDARIKCGPDRRGISGDPTEAALLTAAEKAGITKEDLDIHMPRIDEIPFDSEHAYMATLNGGKDRKFIAVKGAPEKIIAACYLVMLDGKLIELDDEGRQDLMDANRRLASRALRVLAMAGKEAPVDQESISPDDLKEGLVFLGLAGMIDPPRPEAVRAVEHCKASGIRVIMATGDNKTTAGAIASQMGILREGGRVVEGRELEKMTDEQLEGEIDSIDVFARVEPEHKLRIVNALKKRGEVVAMTGDGVNDAPALKRADIGIAMGITGTDVSKEASDMVLADDNFASIVGAVEEGRVIFENIRKVISYLLSTNAGEQLIIAVTILGGFPLPLTPVQILWVNLITDSFPSLALAADPPQEDVLAKPPRDAKESIVSREVLLRIALVASVMAVGTVGLFYWTLQTGDIARARTIAFATMSIFQLINSLNMRSNRISVFKLGIFSNRYLIMAIAASLILQAAVIQVPFFQSLFRTVPLTPFEWLLVFLVSSTILWVGEIRKAIMDRM